MIIELAEQKTPRPAKTEKRKELSVLQASRAKPLRECVRSALCDYLQSLDGHEVTDLHEMLMREVEPPLLETLLDYTQGNQTRTARLLGVSRGTLRKKIVQYRIQR